MTISIGRHGLPEPDENAVHVLLDGRFRVLQVLGRGGMGSVYKVRDSQTSRVRALKIAHEDVGLRASECMLGFTLRNIAFVVETHEVIRTPKGGLALLMEYVDGANLRGWVRTQAPTREDILLALCDVARGMACCAQEVRGFCHLDLKPENCLRTRHGLTKIVDFGLAGMRRKCSQGDPRFSVADVDHPERVSLLCRDDTGDLHVAGTPFYMAPEQVMGETTDGLSADVYSFGLMATELLTGQHPLSGLPLEAVLAGHLRGLPQNTLHLPWRLPRPFRKILRACVNPRPQERPSFDELETVLRGSLCGRDLFLAVNGPERLAETTEDAIRSARSIHALGDVPGAMAHLRRAVDQDPYAIPAWNLGFAYAVEQAQHGKTNTRELLWWNTGKISMGFLDADGRPGKHLVDPSTFVDFANALGALRKQGKDGSSLDEPSYMAWLKNVSEEVAEEVRDWADNHKQRYVERGGHNYTLCLKCGVMKQYILDRCASCGWAPVETEEIFITHIISRLKQADVPEEEIMRYRLDELRRMGVEIQNTVAWIKQQSTYTEGLERFAREEGRYYRKLALGDKRLLRLMRADMHAFVRWLSKGNG